MMVGQSDQGGSGGSGEICLTIKPTVCPDRQNVGCERKRRVTDGSKTFGLSKWKGRVASQLY